MAEKSKKDTASDVVTIDIQPFITPISILLSAIIFSVSLLVGFNMLSNSIKDGGLALGTDNTITADTGDTPDIIAPEEITTGVASIDDDAKLGNKDAKIALIEFSDYNCSFCSRYHTDGTMDSIIQKYVDTGDMIYVYRDFPGVGGETTERVASAAECIKRDLGGSDEQFFEFIKKKYSNPSANDFETLATYVEDIGLDGDKFLSCANEQKYVEEVNADLSDGLALGVTGTPSFLVGVIDDEGNVDGEIIVGAQPYSSFEAAIEAQLARQLLFE